MSIQNIARHNDINVFRSKNPLDIEANLFACDLLMPECEFRAAVKSGIRDFQVLAKMFDVTISAARYRAFTLGYIDKY